MSAVSHMPAWATRRVVSAVPRDRVFLLFAVLLVVARIGMAVWTGFTADDAYITYRYAAHLAEGTGFVYNAGEACLGTSTPLFVLLLAAAGSLLGAGALPAVALGMAILADCVTLAVLWKILERYSGEIRFVAGALWALYPKSVLIATLGMETPLVVACMALSLLLLVRRRADGLLICMAVLLLLRLDTILWCALLAVMAVRERSYPRPMTVVAVFAFLAGCAMLAVGMWGSPIPWSVEAKAVAWSHLFPQFDPVRIVAGLLPFHDSSITWLRLVMIGLVLLILIRALVLLIRRRDTLAVVPGFGLLYLGAFSFGRTVMFDWYYLPAFFSIFLSAGFCWDALPGDLGARRHERFMTMLRGAMVGLLMVLVVAGSARWRHSLGDLFRNEQVRIGDWLALHARPGESVMLEPVGYVGWKSNLYVHDIIGLVSPGVTAYRRQWSGTDRWFIQYVMDRRPTYIILQNREIPENRLFPETDGTIFSTKDERDWFDRHYQQRAIDGHGGPSDHDLFVVYMDLDPGKGRRP